MLILLPGVCLLVHTPTSRNPDLKHLGIVLTKPKQNEFGIKEVLLVKVSSIRSRVPYDSACEMGVTDHAFIKHPSFVFYAHAEKYSEQILKSGFGNEFKNYGMLEEAVLERVTKGLLTSSLTPNGIKRYFLGG